MTLQKTGDNDGEAAGESQLPDSPALPSLVLPWCITVTEMSNQASALNTEVPVSCFLSSPTPQVLLIALPWRKTSREFETLVSEMMKNVTEWHIITVSAYHFGNFLFIRH